MSHVSLYRNTTVFDTNAELEGPANVQLERESGLKAPDEVSITHRSCVIVEWGRLQSA
jgi:hypothetical protein